MKSFRLSLLALVALAFASTHNAEAGVFRNRSSGRFAPFATCKGPGCMSPGQAPPQAFATPQAPTTQAPAK